MKEITGIVLMAIPVGIIIFSIYMVLLGKISDYLEERTTIESESWGGFFFLLTLFIIGLIVRFI